MEQRRFTNRVSRNIERSNLGPVYSNSRIVYNAERADKICRIALSGISRS